MDIGEIVEIGEREIAVPKTSPSEPRAPERKPEPIKEPAREDA